MEGRQLSHVAISDVVDGCRTLCSQAADDIHKAMKERLLECGIEPLVLEELDSIDIPDPFEGLSTAYLQEKYFREHFPYVVC